MPLLGLKAFDGEVFSFQQAQRDKVERWIAEFQRRLGQKRGFQEEGAYIWMPYPAKPSDVFGVTVEWARSDEAVERHEERLRKVREATASGDIEARFRRLQSVFAREAKEERWEPPETESEIGFVSNPRVAVNAAVAMGALARKKRLPVAFIGVWSGEVERDDYVSDQLTDHIFDWHMGEAVMVIPVFGEV
jgi:hypothetical protein